jgi:hypothetical protein
VAAGLRHVRSGAGALQREGAGRVSRRRQPHDVTVTHEFSALEAAQQFAASDELHEAMSNAGIVGEPAIWFANKA